MPKIVKLDKHVAELIAAGEVVERPSSVIKELVENSIDAHASVITVEIKNGGITYMRVTDNGCGIAREDVPTAFLRHATSKVSTADDLVGISTLGFRGEALASVAAVAKVEMLTCTGDGCGTSYIIEGGEEISLDDAGCPSGTTIIIRDIFFNTPARMKFLKKDVSEGNSVAGVVDRLALSHPEISFRFIRDGKQTLITPGGGDLRAAVYAVYGRDFANGLIDVNYELDSVRVGGLICSPSASRASRSMQHFFINGRYVKSVTAMAALEQGFKNSIMVGRFPSCVLCLSVPPESVDINVHPAKIEVRFTDERKIFDAVMFAVKTALAEGDRRPEMKLDVTERAVPREKPSDGVQTKLRLDRDGENFGAAFERRRSEPDSGFFVKAAAPSVCVMHDNAPSYNAGMLDIAVDDETEAAPAPKMLAEAELCKPEPAEPTASETDAMTKADDGATDEEIRLVGEVFDTYIIAQQGDSVFFIDKHAAHERILFERLKKGSAGSQLLLEPVTVTVSKDEFGAVTDNIDLLEKAGFEVEDFGGGSLLVRAVPVMLDGENAADMITEIADGFIGGKSTVQLEKLDWLYHNIACRAAIKGGNHTSELELARLAVRILSENDIRYCPHGRPVAYKLTKKELEKQFGRIQ